MLRLVNIVKDYISGDTTVHALKGVSTSFRKNEFVSILGHSGCGKTTLLNIIGGLDRYTSGDLLIGGVSTELYKDRDWDNYRNHSIGFVFQTYNLIPHQTVLGNVELALTLSGVSRSERRERAVRALEKVGLGDQLNKNPNQLSGGQMQRVAIARALVNDPEIILADEPTGALDTDTSIQIMELLKSVAADRLVIMVTHNPELAQQYSTRIIRLKDGEIISDSMPYTEEEELVAEPKTEPLVQDKKGKKNKKPSMSFLTAFSLSLRNLFTKKARTFLTAFAGSIGIIGIALILSLSNGFQNYINRVEAEALSGYPLTISRTNTSMGMEDFMQLFNKDASADGGAAYPDEKYVYSNPLAAGLLKKWGDTTSRNDLKSFKKWLDGKESELSEVTNAVKYGYSLNYCVYSSQIGRNDKIEYEKHYPFDDKQLGRWENFEETMNSLPIWEQLVDEQDYLDMQYDVIEGSWPKREANQDGAYDVVLSVDKYNRIYDYLLYAIGVMDLYTDILGNTADAEEKSYAFKDLIGKEYKIILAAERFTKNESTELWEDQAENAEYMNFILDKAITIRIAGIIRPKDGTAMGSMGGVIGYTSELTNLMIDKINGLQIIQEQKNSREINVLTGTAFEEEDDYDTLLRAFGVADKETPSSIRFYVKGFEEKEKLIALINTYNESVSESDPDKVIQYTDSVALLMSSVSTIINAVSYVLIAFVSISLIVSSIMIGIITYISVLERTKEIGVLRSIGASKRDISRLFDAETVSIGLMSGLFGIIVTLILNIPINWIIYYLTGLSGLAALPVLGGIALVLISMFLSFIAGFIPSKIAAKKDPVVALRTE